MQFYPYDLKKMVDWLRYRMPKQKTHKGLAKRVKVTANGKIKIHKAGASHLMSTKSAKRRRRIRRTGIVGSNVFTRKMREALRGG